jgi:phosphonate metabolism protein (transferase hexapeptide repeat family)
VQRINCGLPPNPWSADRLLSERPEIDPTTWVQESDFGRYTYLGPRCSVTHSEIGDWSYAMGDNQIAHARIGKFCNIATGVRINPSNHPWWRATLHHFTYRSRSHGFDLADDTEFFEWRARDQVVIGPDVWIGHNAIIMPGTTIGAGAAIGSGAVVTHEVPPYMIVVGVPARLLRPRCDTRTAQRLLDLSWWDWDDARLAAALPDFRALDIQAFAEKYAI